MKNILMIATGGTIASRSTDSGLTPLIGSEDLLRYIPRVSEFCAVTTVQPFNLDSTNVTPSHWLALARIIRDSYNSYDGFVICHGTDTMAYTAAALSYLIQNSSKPIVITGAQKPIDLDITDARTNLTDSFLYACFDGASGVQIVFDGKVIAGTRAKKTRTKSYNAFSSINFPALASIQDGRIYPYIPRETTECVRFYDKLDECVTLYKLTPGAHAETLAYLLERSSAVLLESFGSGGLPDDPALGYYPVIEHYTKLGKVIVMTTQVQSEGSDMTVYRVGRQIKRDYGILESFDMTPEAALTKLMWILSQTHDTEEIRKLFYTTVNFDILYRAQ